MQSDDQGGHEQIWQARPINAAMFEEADDEWFILVWLDIVDIAHIHRISLIQIQTIGPDSSVTEVSPTGAASKLF